MSIFIVLYFPVIMSKTNRKFIKKKVNAEGKTLYKTYKNDSSFQKLKEAGKSVDEIAELSIDFDVNVSNREKQKARNLELSKYDDCPLSSYFEMPLCKHPE